MDVDDTKMKEGDERIGAYRSGAGTLLYIAGDRPDIQFMAKELAGHLQEGSWTSLLKLARYLCVTTGHPRGNEKSEQGKFVSRSSLWTDSLQFPFVRTMTTTGCLKPLVIQIGQETRAEVRTPCQCIFL